MKRPAPTRYEQWLEDQLKDEEFRKEFEEGLDWLRLGASVAILRRKLGLSQAQLAALAHTSQSVISRLEQGENVRLDTVDRVAKALHARLRIELVSATPLTGKGEGGRKYARRQARPL